MPLEQTLALVEQQLAQVSDHLLANDALALERSSAALRHAIASFSEAMVLARRRQALSPALVQRLQDIHTRLGAQRQGLARMAAGNDRLAAVLLPSAPDATYGRALGVRAVSGPRARIYSSTYAH
ncbi:hypothetical protein [Simplicispira psychrophila]|uniref:hypothetical protein n=1 Tax=Simplicispira psychrophila TaxID=80882 RepID=UPI0004817C52|nr:hypothetical protein [Simplicispira psychrophila]